MSTLSVIGSCRGQFQSRSLVDVVPRSLAMKIIFIPWQNILRLFNITDNCYGLKLSMEAGVCCRSLALHYHRIHFTVTQNVVLLQLKLFDLTC
jgi:hypothetical protein